MFLKNRLYVLTAILIASTSLSGCLLAAAGVGAEAGYVATQDDRTAKETLKDQYIVSSVKAKLLADSRVSGLDINVDSFKQVVTLRGALKTQEEIDAALEIAHSSEDVSEVISKLALVP